MPAEEKTVKDVIDSMTEEQKNVMYMMIGLAVEDAKKGNKEEDMKHNVFESDYENDSNVLSHSEMMSIVGDAKRNGSLKDAVLSHGIDNIEYLFPDAQNVDNKLSFIRDNYGWVSEVMGAVSHTSFSRIKSIFANLTEDEARAKGYLKGKMKKEQVFSLLKRSTTPQTIYKKQKLDRDDVVDITDFDVVADIKTEMRQMLDEEIARAILIGDGRLSSDDDKISEDHIRPVFNDDDLFTIKHQVNVANNATDAEIASAAIDGAVKARKNYKGSGNPVLYTTEDLLSEMLLLKDLNGHRIYKDESELATAMRVRKIVAVEPMENLVDANSKPVLGIIVNLADYKVGADKGGAVNMFDDFDIDFNKYTYLIETRCSGALVKPYSAITLILNEAA